MHRKGCQEPNTFQTLGEPAEKGRAPLFMSIVTIPFQMPAWYKKRLTMVTTLPSPQRHNSRK